MKKKILAMLVATVTLFTSIPFSSFAMNNDTMLSDNSIVSENGIVEDTEDYAEVVESEDVFDSTDEINIANDESVVVNNNDTVQASDEYIQYITFATLSDTDYASLNVEQQEKYDELYSYACGGIEAGNVFSSVVFAVDKDGSLVYQFEYMAATLNGCITDVPNTEVVNVEGSMSLIDIDRLYSDMQYSMEEDSDVEEKSINCLPEKEDFLKKQLSKYDKEIYQTAYDTFITNGQNSFSYLRYTGKDDSWKYANFIIGTANAMNALTNTYPEKFDWWHRGADGLMVSGVTLKDCSGVATVSLPKSKYWSQDLENKAQAKVKAVVADAKNYAKTNYPYNQVYGTVVYLNQWVCDNNYYDYNSLNTTKEMVASEEYFNCHSVYGCLLKGYGVCESYALTMNRLLDEAGIPNYYCVGYVDKSNPNSSGHAWNYVKMPDNKLYLLDSTWNDSTNNAYLLVKADDKKNTTKNHYVTAVNWSKVFEYDITWKNQFGLVVKTEHRKLTTKNAFKFPSLNKKSNFAGVEKPESNITTIVAGKKGKLKLNNINYYTKAGATFTSSNPAALTVDNKGKLKALTPGCVTIYMKLGNTTYEYPVFSYKINGIVCPDGQNKQDMTQAGLKPITLSFPVQQEPGSGITVEQIQSMVNMKLSAKSSSKKVAEITETKIVGDNVVVTVTPKMSGKTKVSVNYGGKKAVVNLEITNS